MLVLIYNTLIISIFLFSFLLVGEYLKSKFIKVEFISSFLLGFISVLSVMHVLLIIPLIVKFNFMYSMLLFLATYILAIIYIYKKYNGKKLVEKSINSILNKENYIYYIAIVILTIFTFVAAASISDSWLYTPMVLSTINENSLFYITNDVHWLDSYYFLVSVITKLTLGRDYFFLILGTGLLENTIVIFAFKSLINRYFPNHSNASLLVLVSGLFGFAAVLPHYGIKNMVFFHMFKITASGTLFLYVITTVLLFEYIVSSRKDKLYLLVILLSGFSFSSSTLVVGGVFLVVYFIYHLFFKNIDKETLDVCYITLSVLLVQLLLISLLSAYYSIYSILFIVVIFTLLGVLFNKRNFLFDILISKKELLKKCVLIAAIVLFIIYLLMGSTVSAQISKLFSFNNEKLFGSKYTFYPSVTYNLFLQMLIVTGLYSLYLKKDFTYAKVSLVAVLIFANPISFYVFKEVIPLSIYHRVYMFASLNLIVIEGILFIFNKFKNYKKWCYFIFIIISISMGYNNHQYDNLEFYHFTNSFYESKVGDTDIFEIPENVFDKGDVVYGTLSKYGNNITNYFQVNYDVEYSYELEGADYILCNKESEDCSIYDDNEVYFETSKNIFYFN